MRLANYTEIPIFCRELPRGSRFAISVDTGDSLLCRLELNDFEFLPDCAAATPGLCFSRVSGHSSCNRNIPTAGSILIDEVSNDSSKSCDSYRLVDGL